MNEQHGPAALATALTRHTTRTRASYDRLAPIYDRVQGRAERRIRPWRELLWKRARGARVLELGVGTGKSFPYYPAAADVTAVDLSPKMLERARQRAARTGARVALQLADAQALPFPDATFDTVIATFVFCSVSDPVLGLRETYRVLKPGGQLLLLEHMLSSKRVLRALMQAANPLAVRLMGANINRETVRNVEWAGFTLQVIDDLMGDIVKLIEAEKPAAMLA